MTEYDILRQRYITWRISEDSEFVDENWEVISASHSDTYDLMTNNILFAMRLFNSTTVFSIMMLKLRKEILNL